MNCLLYADRQQWRPLAAPLFSKIVYQLVGADIMKLVSVAVSLEDTAIPFIDVEFPELRTFYLMYLQGLMLWIMGKAGYLLPKFLPYFFG